ncbi:hypothetical protein [Paraburkholderia youngii]|uniref:hypothetical protein n=1 Tax=Paraburkholderia youngii TaxID=2782701 RepID=UPI003D1980E6
MELLNDHVYSVRHVEQWLSECAGLEMGSRKWNKVLNTGDQIVLNADAVSFERVSDTHYRAHRANANEVAEIMSILDKATFSRAERLGVAVMAVVAAVLVVGGAIGLTVTLVRHFILQSY